VTEGNQPRFFIGDDGRRGGIAGEKGDFADKATPPELRDMRALGLDTEAATLNEEKLVDGLAFFGELRT